MLEASFSWRVLAVPAEDLREAALAVEQGGGRMLGVVLNNVSELGGKRKSVRGSVVPAESVPA